MKALIGVTAVALVIGLTGCASDVAQQNGNTNSQPDNSGSYPGGYSWNCTDVHAGALYTLFDPDSKPLSISISEGESC